MHILHKYDMTMLLRNGAGDGSLLLVADAYFGWSMVAMNAVARELSDDDINLKGSTALAKAKKAILNHAKLKADFALICKQQAMRSQIEMSYALLEKVYSIVMTKVCNARFSEVLTNFSEKKSNKE